MPAPSAFRPGLDEADPDDRTPRLVLADALSEESDPRGAVLRAACAIHERVQGITLPDRTETFWTESPGWEATARRLEALAAHPEDTDSFRRRYERLVRGDVPLEPEDPEATLRLQYDLQVRLLTSLDLLERERGERFITAIDDKRYPLPTFADVLARMQLPDLRRKLEQGFDTLLLVPFGLPLERLTDAWRQGLRRNAPTLPGVGAFNGVDPLWVWEQCRTETPVHDPRRFTARHGGHTKEQLLAADHRGWDVLLVEGSLVNLPRAGRGHTVGGRPQSECGDSPAEYLTALTRSGEAGLTPEAYVVGFLDALERRGQVLDTQTCSFLTSAYLPSSRYVPGAYWYPAYGQVGLGAVDPGYRYAYCGARAAVRVA